MISFMLNLKLYQIPTGTPALAQEILAASPNVYQDRGALVGINGFNSIGIEIGIHYWGRHRPIISISTKPT
ncbi:protein of unknown function, might belong to MscS Mechanosensitive ion channel [Shewanella benthica]|uniref:Uncharacterized protein n=1 Tax=Shewanella benthica TaxID=43661 RepID=A0A330M2W7_9GAMM|nr:protein of unknown function, might belong to MscS Mechanosensitive ion channel [Shewanella benthica]